MRGQIITPKTILSSAARAPGSGTSNSFKNRVADSVRLFIDVTNIAAGPGTLIILIETSADNSQWYTVTTVTTISATGNYTDTATVLGPYVRISYTIVSGTYTFEVKMSKINRVR